MAYNPVVAGGLATDEAFLLYPNDANVITTCEYVRMGSKMYAFAAFRTCAEALAFALHHRANLEPILGHNLVRIVITTDWDSFVVYGRE